MIKNSVILLIALLFTQISTFAQSTHVPLNRDYYHLIERYEIKSKGLMPGLFSTVKPLKRNEVAMLADSLLSSGQVWSSKDLFNLQYLADDNWEFSEHANWDRDEIFLDKYRFTGIEDIQRTGDRWFRYQMNPVLGASVGVDTEAGGNVRFMSSIGAEVRGSLFNRVAVYGYFTQNWAVFPTYVQDRISDVGVIPGEGYFDNMGNQGHSFTTPRFNVSTKVAKHIDLQAGFDRNFIGNGHRSMILSDFGNNNFYIKANAKLGHFNYTMIQNVMRADAYGIYGESSIGESFPKKYQAFHRLGIDIGKNFNLGIFETVVYGRERENGANPIELGYMVPAIFFRATEQQVGSADNALLGIDYKWNFLSSFSFYGQVIFDEFVLEEIRSGEGWWANKFGIQTGLKYIDAFGVSNLDLQVEGNITRPYNYTHQDNFNSYTHFLQPIAHPFGTNFKEVVGILRYQPRERLHIVARGFYNQFGADDADTNWGGDILKPYTSREQNYGNVIGQGIDTKILYADLTLSYMLKHNLYADFRTVYRNLTSEISSRDRTTSFTQIGLRLNLSQRDHDF